MANKSDAALRSRATGGAGTGGGVEYQTVFAVHLALDAFSRRLRENPVESTMLDIEPREIGLQSVTRWDVGTRGDASTGIAHEVKAKPTKKDVIGFLQQVRVAVEQGTAREYWLVHSEGAPPQLRAIETIRLIREEAGDDEARFSERCGIESGSVGEAIDLLGDACFRAARRLHVTPLPIAALESAIDFQIRYLVPSDRMRQLRDFLVAEFLTAMHSRKSFLVPSLMARVERAGIEFLKPESAIPVNIDPVVHSSLHVLQQCDGRLPSVVLREVVGLDSDRELDEKLTNTDAVIQHEGGWSANPLPAALEHREGDALVEKALRGTLDFIRANRRNDAGLAQVDNAMALATKCSDSHPQTAITAFGTVDGLLKRRGRKRDVLDLAQMTVEWARRLQSTDARKAQAKALICGCSWVFQRVGELHRAQAHADESLQLGRNIGWERNTAFCHKCIGRLHRIRGEHATNKRTAASHFNASVKSLGEAIESFRKCGNLEPEIGDCNSLLGRTQLLAGRLQAAVEAAAEARLLLVDTNDKDYLDLLILEGDIANKRLDYSTANAKYQEAIERAEPGNCEHSEIIARGLLARGNNLFAWRGTAEAACDEIERALRMWEEADDWYHVGVARWRLSEIRGEVSREVARRLRAERPSVRVEALRLHGDRTARQSKMTLSQRASLSDRAWEDLVGEARRNDEIRTRHW